ncbi:MAG: hypothetical protein B6245_08790 [Desulfobacteraceae bacterium 4572_88]|nr:MAG: hypothetical protein B6245_08790 [Desulfobacteraceae bacterium 4572_88]
MNIRQIFSLLILLFVFQPVSEPRAGTSPGQLVEMGKEFCRNGDFEHAALLWEQAVIRLNAEKETARYVDTIIHLAWALQSLGYYEKTRKALDSALPVAEKIGNQYDKARFFSALGDIHLSLGNTDEADRYLTKALEHARPTEDPRIIAPILTDAGNLLAADGDYEGALAAYTESLIFADQLEDEPELKSEPLINILYITCLAGDAQEIETALNQTVMEIGNLPDSHDKARKLIALTQVIRKIRRDPALKNIRPSRAFLINAEYHALNRAQEIAEVLTVHRLTSHTLGYMGQLYEDENRLSDAATLTRRAIFFAQQGNFPEILYLWQWQLGRLFRASDDIENAVGSYRNAVSTLTPIRGKLFRGFSLWQDTFDRQIKPVYLELVELLLKQAETAHDDDDRESRLREARDTMERLKTAELEDFFMDECVTLMQSKKTILNRTPPHTAVIYPIVLPEKLALLLTLPDSMTHISVPVASRTLGETITRFRKKLQNRMNNRFLYEAEQLYDWVIRPLEPILREKKINTLVVAPDGPLRLVPLSALNDGTRFLVEKYALSIIPGVTLTDLRPIRQENIEILLTGLSQGRQGFSPLPSVTAELRDIKKIMNARDVLENKEFTVGNLTTKFRNYPYTIVHMATHGVFGGTPGESFLLNYDTRLTMDGLDDLVGIGKFRDNPLELLTLSACQTALGNERAALGLAGVAVKAGAKSVIATLWYVDDEATSLAVREFYRQLRTGGISKAQALQNTQKKLIAQRRYWHPLYWAPFLLIGNWM